MRQRKRVAPSSQQVADELAHKASDRALQTLRSTGTYVNHVKCSHKWTCTDGFSGDFSTNCHLCFTAYCPPVSHRCDTPPAPPSNNSSSVWVVVILTVLLTAFVVLSIVLVVRKRKKYRRRQNAEIEFLEKSLSNSEKRAGSKGSKSVKSAYQDDNEEATKAEQSPRERLLDCGDGGHHWWGSVQIPCAQRVSASVLTPKLHAAVCVTHVVTHVLHDSHDMSQAS